MAHAKGSIGTTNYAVTVRAGHHELVADEGADLGGRDRGPAPYDLLAASLCACTAITLRMYAERKQWPLQAAHVDVHVGMEGDRRTIDRVLTLEGPLSPEQKARMADIAERTPVTLTLKAGLPIRTRLA